MVANEPLRTALVDYARHAHYEVHACTTPLDAIQALEKHGQRFAYAMIASDLPWALELRQLLADDYSNIAIETIAV